MRCLFNIWTPLQDVCLCNLICLLVDSELMLGIWLLMCTLGIPLSTCYDWCLSVDGELWFSVTMDVYLGYIIWMYMLGISLWMCILGLSLGTMYWNCVLSLTRSMLLLSCLVIISWVNKWVKLHDIFPLLSSGNEEQSFDASFYHLISIFIISNCHYLIPHLHPSLDFQFVQWWKSRG